MGRMVGVISSTDILTSEAEAQDAVEREALFEQMMVRDIMTPPSAYCHRQRPR